MMQLYPDRPKALLQACPGYQTSALGTYEWRGERLFVKDETNRMGLGAFKAVGGVYAVAKLIEAQLGRALSAEDYASEEVRRHASQVTFVCASAGNHGMSVAAGARVFGAQARIHLARSVPEAFAGRLQAKGAQVVWSGDTYEESVDAAVADAQATGAVHLADGSWPGYTEPPRLVMEGYTIIAAEMRDQLANLGQWPSHVFLQAGVGGLAAAVAYMIRQDWPVQPRIIVVEPDAAACLRDSVVAGTSVTVEGPVSNMGRLDCKAPSMLAFEVLSELANEFVTITDQQAEDGVTEAKTLGYVSTPSGAAGLSALMLSDDKIEAPLVILSEGAVG